MSATDGLATTARQPGHAFTVRGDLTKLSCDAVVVPTSGSLRVTQHWRDVVPLASTTPDSNGWLPVAGTTPTGWGEADRSLRLEDDHLGRHVWLARTDAWEHDGQWVAEGIVQAVERAAQSLDAPSRRATRLIGVPLAGTGAGGFDRRRGEVVEALVPALEDVARRTGIDVALVLADDQDHAAVQACRARLAGGPGSQVLDEKRLREADRLGTLAAEGQLVLFLGAGVSLAAGLPSWKGLLAELADKAGLDTPGLEDLDPQDAAQLAYQQLQPGVFDDFMRERFTLRRHALAHGLLAGLRVDSVVTTNYDDGYELAADAVQPPDRRLRVLPREYAEAGCPWLLKMHGDVADPQSIVLTREHYVEYGGGRAPLTGLVQAMLMTRHMLFVGFSLVDDNFARLAHQVRRVLRESKAGGRRVGTVLALQREPAREQLWRSDLHYVAMTEPPPKGVEQPIQPAARELEIFLDRLAWKATTIRSGREAFLLDPRYDAVQRDAAEVRLRDKLQTLLGAVEDADRGTPAWRSVRAALAALGAPPDRLDG